MRVAHTLPERRYLFGALTVIRAEGFQDAFDIVNCTEYGLTGFVERTNP